MSSSRSRAGPLHRLFPNEQHMKTIRKRVRHNRKVQQAFATSTAMHTNHDYETSHTIVCKVLTLWIHLLLQRI